MNNLITFGFYEAAQLYKEAESEKKHQTHEVGHFYSHELLLTLQANRLIIYFKKTATTKTVTVTKKPKYTRSN